MTGEQQAARLGGVAGFVAARVEAVLQGRRRRAAVATALAPEIAINAQELGEAQLERVKTPVGYPRDFRISMVMFQALAAHIGEFPPAMTSDILTFDGACARAEALYREIEEAECAVAAALPGTAERAIGGPQC